MIELKDIMAQLSGYVGWKDLNLRYLGCNSNLADILHLQRPDKITGLTDQDLPGDDEAVYAFHKKNDERVLNGETIKSLHKSTTPYDGSFFYFVKKPLFQGSQITGLIFQCHEWDRNHFIQSLHETDKKHFSIQDVPSHYQLENFSNPFQLSTRELECLFFTLRGKSAKVIGEHLQLSKRTVEAYIENIKNKFGCYTKAELVVVAMSNGYLNFIPTTFYLSPCGSGRREAAGEGCF